MHQGILLYTVLIHHNPILVKENEKLYRMVRELFDIFYEDLNAVGIKKYLANMNEDYLKSPRELLVTDFLSGMTDTYLLDYYKKVFLPKWHTDFDDE